ncbi:MAG TPA: 4'-phosphopantetheinyl transferase superfamily protein [Ignavibacteriaceae bacterium]|nr:4'-phosphopantetheinyl transferase superfamily protein [Ignavibacteriaceae bacterium]
MRKRIYFLIDEQFGLPEDEVHIWNFDLNKHLNQIEEFVDILSNDELIRASKFHFDRDKNWFILGRGLLRIFVNIYTGIPVQEINFSFNDFGKPSLSPAYKNNQLHFNLSHSKQFMSVGFVKDALIGVDVELMKPLKDHLEIARRFFSNSEIEQLNAFPKEKILEGFYSCWTGKEAVIKLSGEGLSYPLKDFDVQLKELNVNESYRYKVNLKSKDENLFVEVFRLQKDLFGACSVNKENLITVFCYFEDTVSSINSLLTK